ncbi:MAG: DUF4105 domain-containing protein [Tannerella sp.]|jgi:hypothetical protein|nr:DUF4105 domain-containing protein [Tannerella sp.]
MIFITTFAVMKVENPIKILLFVMLGMMLTAFEADAKVRGAVAMTRLGEQAEVSLLTCSPSDEDVYTLYGHTAIRVRDPEMQLDVVFNYGIFDFSKPNFIYRFAKGETDYMLRACDFNDFFVEYAMRGSEVCEQVLNLHADEKDALLQALILNERPENRVYRYSFFFDNCATRPAIMIENNIDGDVTCLLKPDNKTFRDVINCCTREHPWVTFGCDLVLGLPTDRVMSRRESFFLPEKLREEFANAVIIRRNKTSYAGFNADASEPLVAETGILSEGTGRSATDCSDLTPSPLTSAILLFLIMSIVTVMEWRRKTYFPVVDALLFIPAGLAGCILFFLSFISVHQSIYPNISLLWLHPLHLVGAGFFVVKKLKKAAICYHFINFAAILVMITAWFFVPQHFNIAFAPLIACLALRSATRLKRKDKI